MSQNETRPISNTEHKTILYYGLVVLVIGGGIGVYFPLFFDKRINAESLATYALASLAPLWADIFLPEMYWRELSRIKRMKIGAMCAVGGLSALAALFRNGKTWDLTFAVVGTVVILILLYEICILSGRFRPENPPKTEDGGASRTVNKLNGEGLE